MAKTKTTAAAPPNRWLQLGAGILLGFLWGSLMWGLVTIFGQESGGAKGWLYIAVSMAMIGGGVSAIFGAMGARKRGERISPRVGRRDEPDGD